MSYILKSLSLQPSTLASQSLTSAADVNIFSVPSNCRAQRVQCKIQTAVVSTGNVVVNFVLRPTTGSATGEVILATVNIPGGAAVGTTYYKDVSSKAADVGSGQEVIARVATAAAGGGAAGACYAQVIVAENPEVPLNEANLIASS